MNKDLKLVPHLVPKPLWGKSAANLLPRASWDRIRADILTAANHKCQVCKEKSRMLSCHEMWLYDDKNGVATLVEFRMQCRDCDQVVHMGRAVKHGGGRAALIHLCRINFISPKEGRAIYDGAMADWKERSKRTWRIDVAKALLERYPQLSALIESTPVPTAAEKID